jgi:hypothetical protein
VQAGPLHDGLQVITGGLAASDKVIINGLMRARPGGRVTPVPGTIQPGTIQPDSGQPASPG